jgi:hypothetical protein
VTYPSDSDPKNIKYVLWKNGLYGMNLDATTGTMIGDGRREKVVIGKSKSRCRKSLAISRRPQTYRNISEAAIRPRLGRIEMRSSSETAHGWSSLTETKPRSWRSSRDVD